MSRPPCFGVTAVVGTLGGKTLNVECMAQIEELRNAIFRDWRIPVACQKLVCNHCQEILPDDADVGTHTLDNETLSCTLLVSLETVLVQLQSHNRSVGLRALKDLYDVGYKASDDIISAVLKHMEHSGAHDAGVKRATMEVLGAVAARGDEKTMLVIMNHLRDGAGVARRTAVEALGSVAPIDDAGVISKVVKRLADPDEAVKRAAQNTLTRVVSIGNRCAVRLVSANKFCDNAATRRVAVETLSKVSAAGDEAVMALLIDCLNDKDINVRRSAAEALKQIMKPDDQCVIEALAQCDLALPTIGMYKGGVLGPTIADLD